jgi:hypothetical protein
MRIEYKGWPAPVKVGYRGPRIARGLHPSGFKEVLVHNVDELKEIDVKTQAARIAHTVGRRKKAKILAEAKKRKIIILNLKEIKKPPEQEKEELAEEKEEETVKTEEAPTEEKEVEESKPEKTRKRKRRTEKQ